MKRFNILILLVFCSFFLINPGTTLVALAGGDTCHGDFDGDGQVGVSDILIIFANWGECPDKKKKCTGDLTEDDYVNVLDLLELLEYYGPCDD